MTDVPKIVPRIVYERLRAAQPEQAHPEADLLTAFAEQALSAAERDSVLEHMARCGECREAVTLTLPSAAGVAAPIADNAEEVASVSRARAPAPHKPVFTWASAWAWPHLRWATVAAGVAVVAAVLLMRPGKVNQTDRASTNSASNSLVATALPADSGPGGASSPAGLPSTGQSAVSAKTDEGRRMQPAPSSTNGLVAVPTASSPEVVLPSIASPMTRSSGSVKTDAVRPRPESPSKQLQATEAGMPKLQVKSEIVIADDTKDSAEKANAPLPEGARALDYGASTSRGATETVQVSGAAVALETRPSTGGDLMAQSNTPAIVKAKEPSQAAVAANGRPRGEAGAAGGSVSVQGRNVMSMAKLAAPSSSTQGPAAWVIKAGVLQRSLDSGQTWQIALRTDRPLLVWAIRDPDVWAGGEAGTLFHSTNGGIVWVQVRPSIKDQQLSSDVTHIDVRSSTQTLVSTSNNEVWITLDGGTTWNKK